MATNDELLREFQSIILKLDFARKYGSNSEARKQYKAGIKVVKKLRKIGEDGLATVFENKLNE